MDAGILKKSKVETIKQK